VLGGAPKVGKSDFLISLFVHMAAGVPFLGFAPSRPLRNFYLQAEIHTICGSAFRPSGSSRRSWQRRAIISSPRLCIDPIRNLFDGGPDGGGENDNTAMLFFLQERVEALRDEPRMPA